MSVDLAMSHSQETKLLLEELDSKISQLCSEYAHRIGDIENTLCRISGTIKIETSDKQGIA